MIEEAKKTKIGELREEGISVREIANTLNISESTVKRYSSDNYEKDNELDEKISNEMTKIMLLEGYDFEDEIKPIIYALKDEVNEMDITLWNHINDIKNNTKMFLRLTDNPIRLYYIFMLFASNLNLITDHIEPENLINAVDNFIDREVSMEDAENYIDTWSIIRQEEYDKLGEKILNAKEEYIKGQEEFNELVKKISRGKEVVKNLALRKEYWNKKLLENPSGEEQLQNALKTNTGLQVLVQKFEIGYKMLEAENQELRKSVQESEEKIQKITQQTPTLLKEFDRVKQENSILEKAFEQFYHQYPEETKNIINLIDNNKKMKDEKLQRTETPIS